MTATTDTGKSITWNRFDHDYTAEYSGNYIGSFKTQLEAENALNEHVYDLFEQGLINLPPSCDPPDGPPTIDTEPAEPPPTGSLALIADYLSDARWAKAKGLPATAAMYVQAAQQICAQVLTDPDPEPVPPPWGTPCASCQGNGRACIDCGALDVPAIGRKIQHLLHNDTKAFIDLLTTTQRRWWPLLAHSYALTFCAVDDPNVERVLVETWNDLLAA